MASEKKFQELLKDDAGKIILTVLINCMFIENKEEICEKALKLNK